MKKARQILSLVLALVLTVFVLDAAYRGLGPLPPLGPAFNPSTGVWSMAKTAKLPTTQSQTLPQLIKPV